MNVRVGDIVHFVGFDRTCVAAIITEVAPSGLTDHVSLTIFPPDAANPVARTAKQDETTKARGTWHAPEPPSQDMDLTA